MIRRIAFNLFAWVIVLAVAFPLFWMVLTSVKPLPLFAQDLDGEGIVEPKAHLPAMSLGEEVVEDYVSMRLTLRAHPVALLRHILTPAA